MADAGRGLVLIGGLGASRFGVARLLGSRPFTWLGDRSYGLYLWHWPILLAYLAISERTVATPLAGLVIMGASVLAADLTLRFIEGPTRYLSDAKPWRILIAGAAAVAVAGGVAVGWIGYTKFQARAEWARLADAEAYPGAAAFGRDIPEAPVTPGPFTVRADRPELYDNGCHQSETGTATPNCVYGDPDAPYTLAVVGGSHVTQWFPALQGAVEGSEWKLMIFTKSACLFRETPEPHEPPSCAVWNRNVMAELERLRPDAIFTTTTRGEYAADEIAPGLCGPLARAGGAGHPNRGHARHAVVPVRCGGMRGAVRSGCGALLTGADGPAVAGEPHAAGDGDRGSVSARFLALLL